MSRSWREVKAINKRLKSITSSYAARDVQIVSIVSLPSYAGHSLQATATTMLSITDEWVYLFRFIEGRD